MDKDYLDALERAKSIKDSIIASHNKESASFYTGFIDNIFPELKESEDERIRKELVGYLKDCRNDTDSEVMIDKYGEWIAYLEKQKEQKESVTTEWPKVSNCPKNCKKCLAKCFYRKEAYEEKKPVEWSEEDKNFIKELCDLLASIAKDNYVGRYYAPDLVSKLQSLRPHWKPSKEQINALKVVALGYSSDDIEALESLLNDLQKLL